MAQPAGSRVGDKVMKISRKFNWIYSTAGIRRSKFRLCLTTGKECNIKR